MTGNCQAFLMMPEQFSERKASRLAARSDIDSAPAGFRSSRNSAGETLIDEPVKPAPLAPGRALASRQSNVEARVVACLCHRNATAAMDAELLRAAWCRKAADCSGRQNCRQNELTHRCLPRSRLPLRRARSPFGSCAQRTTMSVLETRRSKPHEWHIKEWLKL
jgi:hypothetical protein